MTECQPPPERVASQSGAYPRDMWRNVRRGHRHAEKTRLHDHLRVRHKNHRHRRGDLRDRRSCYVLSSLLREPLVAVTTLNDSLNSANQATDWRHKRANRFTRDVIRKVIAVTPVWLIGKITSPKILSANMPVALASHSTWKHSVFMEPC